ncbi:MAG: hypothetical protein CHKLHMKO_00118 [Candidatus Argoarchaeum ethanivorans]|uniref:Uncharacterized protein n=1 Tax=Candidatus Argoarchaeum ethanivorans TaxID=2608793 RepID=A0A811T2R0_9EURY|nr:MAG: hypothetical protein CHKLHMKO_00118 [Candidatus Argoarchaeum ethanivorans]
MNSGRNIRGREEDEIKSFTSVRGIIIVNEFDEWLDYAVSVSDNILLLYYEVKLVVWDAKSGNPVSVVPNIPTSK